VSAGIAHPQLYGPDYSHRAVKTFAVGCTGNQYAKAKCRNIVGTTIANMIASRSIEYGFFGGSRSYPVDQMICIADSEIYPPYTARGPPTCVPWPLK